MGLEWLPPPCVLSEFVSFVLKILRVCITQTKVKACKGNFTQEDTYLATPENMNT